MQRCRNCGKEIRFIATGVNTCVAVDAEKLNFVTENGRITSGYLVHICEKTENENGKSKESEN